MCQLFEVNQFSLSDTVLTTQHREDPTERPNIPACCCWTLMPWPEMSCPVSCPLHRVTLICPKETQQVISLELSASLPIKTEQEGTSLRLVTNDSEYLTSVCFPCQLWWNGSLIKAMQPCGHAAMLTARWGCACAQFCYCHHANPLTGQIKYSPRLQSKLRGLER